MGEMDAELIRRHNDLVKPEDHWYCLGDVAMRRPKYVKRQLEALNGHKRLIRGNHDIYKTREYLEFFEEICGVRVIDRILFSHFPVHPSSLGPYVANVHGHIHEKDSPPPVMVTWGKDQNVKWVPYINISVEKTDYKPVSLEWIKGEIGRLTDGQCD